MIHKVGDIVPCRKCNDPVLMTKARIRSYRYCCSRCNNGYRTTEDYRKYQRQPHVLERRKIRARSYYAKNKEKQRAHILVIRAVKSGKLKPSACELCGDEKNIHGHHEDYSKPLVVVWLCARCHSRIHANHVCLLPSLEATL